MNYEHEREILGTVAAVLFGLFAIFAIASVVYYDSLPVWLSVLIVWVFGGSAVYALYRVFKYWRAKIREKNQKE